MSILATLFVTEALIVTSVLFVAWQPLGEKTHKKYFGFKPFSCYICLPIWATIPFLFINWYFCGASVHTLWFCLLPLVLPEIIYRLLP